MSGNSDPRSPTIIEARINERIRVPEVRLVGPNGEQVGIVRVEDALRLAQEADLDLVEVAPDARPPVCKLMDYGKFKYEADMKAREARRNQGNTVLKEIRFRLKIDPHDYGTKKGHVERFLTAGDKVKVMIMFRGREQSRPEMGLRLLQRLADDVVELGFVESSPRQDGRNMIMVLGPTKKKSEAKQTQRKREPRPAAPEGEGTDEVAFDVFAAAARPTVQPIEAPDETVTPVEQAAPLTEDVPFEAAETTAEVVPAAPVTRPAAAPRATAPRTAAPRAAAAAAPAAPAAPAPAPAAPSSAPVAAPKPAAPKPGAPKPAPPKPSAAPKPAARTARPASATPRPSTRKPPSGGDSESS